MAASAADSRPAKEICYVSLRADFDAAYKRMMDSSREFNAILMTVPAGLSLEAQQARKDSAAQAYEDAHERFIAAVGKLNKFMIGQIISSRAALSQLAPIVDRTAGANQALR
jgi:hypothetical protein